MDKENRRGLIFCNRNEEAEELSRMFNVRGFRTLALSGSNSDAERDAAIARLGAGEIEYIFSVDIFNEGGRYTIGESDHHAATNGAGDRVRPAARARTA